MIIIIIIIGSAKVLGTAILLGLVASAQAGAAVLPIALPNPRRMERFDVL